MISLSDPAADLLMADSAEALTALTRGNRETGRTGPGVPRTVMGFAHVGQDPGTPGNCWRKMRFCLPISWDRLSPQLLIG